jgi:hypothetical protein
MTRFEEIFAKIPQHLADPIDNEPDIEPKEIVVDKGKLRQAGA